MPLLDHFHAPLFPHRRWESIHAAWMGSISDSLNRILPAGYFAEEEAHAGANVQIDVATFEETSRVSETQHGSGGTAVAALPTTWAPPTATVSAAFADDFELKVLTDRGGGLRVVGAIELISPSNKDPNESRAAFAVKCASYLSQGVAVIIVDIVTEREANLHAEILEILGSPAEAPIPGNTPLYAAAYRPIRRGTHAEIDIWPESLALGIGLPTLPLWLSAVACVGVDLEATYIDTCRRRRIPT